MTTRHQHSWLKRCLWAVAAFALAVAVGCVSAAGQPHMHAALDELRAARGELDAAVADKGGHRVRAIALVDAAIDQTRMGIEFARSH